MKRQHRWFAGIVLASALAAPLSESAAAEPRLWNSGQTITDEPKMNFIPNTDVYYQRRAPGYDLYRYADRWYLVQEGIWHEATTWRGPFAVVEVDSLPESMFEVPQPYRKYWDEDAQPSWASKRSFTKKPKMAAIGEKGVTYAQQLSDFDLYRYKSGWYLIEDGVWYRSDSWKGPFMSTRASFIPRAVLDIPEAYRRHWQVPAAQ
jgi:hypothetical protein